MERATFAQYNFKISRDQWFLCAYHSSLVLNGNVLLQLYCPPLTIVEFVFLLRRSMDQEWPYLNLMWIRTLAWCFVWVNLGVSWDGGEYILLMIGIWIVITKKVNCGRLNYLSQFLIKLFYSNIIMAQFSGGQSMACGPNPAIAHFCKILS